MNRRLILRSSVGLALLGATLVGAPAAPATSLGVSKTKIDPALVAQVAKGTSIAIFNWDEQSTSRAEVLEHLAASGTDAHLFESFSVGYACAGSFGDLANLASIPGAKSLVANEELEPATDKSVPNAFNGSPSAVWSNPPSGLGVTGRGVAIAVLDTGLDTRHPDLGPLASAEDPNGKTKANVRVMMGHRDTLGPGNEVCPPMDVYTDEPFPGLRPGSSADTERLSGHGTHIAGVAAGSGIQDPKYKGMAPDAQLVGVAITDSVNASANTVVTAYKPTTLNAIAGFDYITNKAVSEDPSIPGDKAINVRVVLAGWVQKGTLDQTHPLFSVLENVHAQGISVVMPTGNAGPNQSDCSKAETCRFNPWAGWAQYRDWLGNDVIQTPVVGVAAGPRTSRRTLAQYSSRGDPQARVVGAGTISEYTAHYEPTLTAPGTATAARRLGTTGFVELDPTVGAGPEKGKALDANPYYQTLSGTSVAAAHVAGAIALMHDAAYSAKGCYLTSNQVRSILQQTATAMPGYGVHEVGAGMLDATAATQLAQAIAIDPSIDPSDQAMCPDPS